MTLRIYFNQYFKQYWIIHWHENKVFPLATPLLYTILVKINVFLYRISKSKLKIIENHHLFFFINLNILQFYTMEWVWIIWHYECQRETYSKVICPWYELATLSWIFCLILAEIDIIYYCCIWWNGTKIILSEYLLCCRF